MDFKEFAIAGREFNIKGLTDVYKIIKVDSDKVVVTMTTSGAVFPIEIGNAEDSFNIGLWVAKVSQPIASNQDGLDCSKCKKFFEFAAPNQDDGTMICWGCRNGF